VREEIKPPVANDDKPAAEPEAKPGVQDDTPDSTWTKKYKKIQP
jgi:hypothetical protein